MNSKPIYSIWNDNSGWIDFTLSKVALIIASFIILTATYHIAPDLGNLNAEQEINTIALDIRAAIDSADSSGFEAQTPIIKYSFKDHITFSRTHAMEAYVSGEYVRISTIHDDRKIYAVKPLTFKVLPLDEEELMSELLVKFGHNGSKNDCILESPTSVMDFLLSKGTTELSINTSENVFIKKTFIHIENNSRTNRLEYILVYQ